MRNRQSKLWAEVARRLPQADHVAVLSDFDGTLAAIVSRPRSASLPATTRRNLQRLARCPRARVGIVSGRRLEELRRLVGVSGIWYIGSHGLEICPPQEPRQVRASAAERRRMQALRRRLAGRLRGLAGIWVESKPASFTVHFRGAKLGATRAARQVVEEEWRRAQAWVRVQEGKKVWDFLPARDVSKASAVARLLARWKTANPQRCLTLYLGDDEADERVFRRLGPAAISVVVGRRSSRARYRLGSPAAVGRFLGRLVEVLACA